MNLRRLRRKYQTRKERNRKRFWRLQDMIDSKMREKDGKKIVKPFAVIEFY